jgi:hypothetical protein
MKFAAALLLSLAATTPAAEITFHKQVLPILQNNCQGCHRAGEAAPMSLISYKEVRPFAKAIKAAVSSKKMPPWFADRQHGKFSNDTSLSPSDIETLSAWADSGAKEGDPKDAPAPKAFTQGWTIGQPDLVIEMPAAHKVPASGTIEYTYFVVPTGFTEDKWVEKIEVRPGASSVVHHIIALNRPKGSGYLKDAPVGTAYIPPAKPTISGKKASGDGSFVGLTDGLVEMLSVYVPGGFAYDTKPGQARLIPAGSDIIFQMHYVSTGKETLDRSSVGIIFAKTPPKERVINAYVRNDSFVIPPGEANYRVDANVEIQADTKLQSLMPHMHLRGKAFEYVATYPTGETHTLLKVPNYDFNWQLTYQLAQPLLLPKGTKLRATAWFDNSPNNKFNPDPKSEVRWGDQSWEEMVAGFVDFVLPADVNPASIASLKR